MRGFLIEQVARPLIRRIGTAAGAWLLGAGVMVGEADAITAGVVAALGVGIDLVASAKNRSNAR